MAIDPYSSPLAFFGAELKRLRERASMTQSDVAGQTNYALSTVSAYETGTRIPSADFAKRADSLFGTDSRLADDEGDLTRLQHLVEQISVRPWFRDRVEVERKATEIREFDSYQIPGAYRPASSHWSSLVDPSSLMMASMPGERGSPCKVESMAGNELRRTLRNT